MAVEEVSISLEHRKRRSERLTNNEIAHHQHHSLEPMGFAILDEVIDKNNGNEKHRDLEAIEVERHVSRLPKTDPANDNHERQDEQRNLQTGTDGNADGEIHFVFDGDGDGGGVLGGVADDGEQDEADELFGNFAVGGDGVDRADHILCAESD